MRKRLVMIGAATSVLVAASGFAATTAGADEKPDIPDLPGFAVPDLNWPPFSADEDPGDPSSNPDISDMSVDGGARSGPDVGPQLAPAHDEPGPDRPSRDQAGRDQAGRDQAGRDLTGRDQGGGNGSGRDRAGASGLVAASREAVTAADVSSSPSAPLQQQVLALVNQNRRRGGCDDLSLDRRLIDAANDHAADMARRRYFAHESPNGDGAGDRVREAGYRWRRYGENIARGVDSAYEVVDGWMHSPEHRENIMDCRLSQMGVGLAIAGDDTRYWVQDFATPMD